jgi:anti-anti-sigma regulatory factor
MTKFTVMETAPGDRVIRVEGRLEADAGTELRALCDSLRGPDVTLDLAGLEWADGAGVEFLAGLRRRGWRLVGGSLYITTLLEARA